MTPCDCERCAPGTEQYRHECEVRALRAMPEARRNEYLRYAREKRGEAAYLKLTEDLKK